MLDRSPKASRSLEARGLGELSLAVGRLLEQCVHARGQRLAVARRRGERSVRTCTTPMLHKLGTRRRFLPEASGRSSMSVAPVGGEVSLFPVLFHVLRRTICGAPQRTTGLTGYALQAHLLPPSSQREAHRSGLASLRTLAAMMSTRSGTILPCSSSSSLSG
jgi:hypothetical protein